VINFLIELDSGPMLTLAEHGRAVLDAMLSKRDRSPAEAAKKVSCVKAAPVAAMRWSMWTPIVTTIVFAGSVAGGVAVNTTFLDFPDERKC
jgi:hypothetical protein